MAHDFLLPFSTLFGHILKINHPLQDVAGLDPFGHAGETENASGFPHPMLSCTDKDRNRGLTDRGGLSV